MTPSTPPWHGKDSRVPRRNAASCAKRESLAYCATFAKVGLLTKLDVEIGVDCGSGSAKREDGSLENIDGGQNWAEVILGGARRAAPSSSPQL